MKQTKKEQDKMLKSLLVYLYVKNKLSLREIAGQFGMCYDYIRVLLKKYGIKRRTIFQSLEGRYPTKNKFYRDKVWLKYMYWQKGLSIREVAKISGFGRGAITKSMKRLNIKTRTKSEGILLKKMA